VDRTRTGNLSSTLRVFVLTKIGETQPPPE
jgi:predicted DNA-binding ribbon-helix-helix protein